MRNNEILTRAKAGDELAEEGTKALRDAINRYCADKGIPFTANLMNTINSMAA